jgi:pimeloyl-ACP methyl ester carboxylesterase
MSAAIFQRIALVRKRKTFYREAGEPSAPTILLLNGLPGGSADYRNLDLPRFSGEALVPLPARFRIELG